MTLNELAIAVLIFLSAGMIVGSVSIQLIQNKRIFAGSLLLIVWVAFLVAFVLL